MDGDFVDLMLSNIEMMVWDIAYENARRDGASVQKAIDLADDATARAVTEVCRDH
jgi:hypothetical protein